MTIFAVTSFLNGLQYSSSCVLKNVDLFLTTPQVLREGRKYICNFHQLFCFSCYLFHITYTQKMPHKCILTHFPMSK